MILRNAHVAVSNLGVNDPTTPHALGALDAGCGHYVALSNSKYCSVGNF